MPAGLDVDVNKDEPAGLDGNMIEDEPAEQYDTSEDDGNSYLLANPRLVEAPRRRHSSAAHRCSTFRTRYHHWP